MLSSAAMVREISCVSTTIACSNSGGRSRSCMAAPSKPISKLFGEGASTSEDEAQIHKNSHTHRCSPSALAKNARSAGNSPFCCLNESPSPCRPIHTSHTRDTAPKLYRNSLLPHQIAVPSDFVHNTSSLTRFSQFVMKAGIFHLCCRVRVVVELL